MKKQNLPCINCGIMTEHLLDGEDGVYEAVCRICKKRGTVAIAEDLDDKGKDI